MNKSIALTLFLGVFIFFNTNAQIGFAVAQDEKGSALEWHIIWNVGPYYKAASMARQKLKTKGYKTVYEQASTKSGHEIKNGYWVVIRAKYKVYNGMKIGYGMGASATSYAEAERQAVKNLSTNNWSWKSNYGYDVDRRGTYKND